jgi:hypothetical protein
LTVIGASVSPERPTFILAIPTDGDATLAERLCRSLRAELDEINGIDVRFAQSESSVAAGAKSGPAVADAALWLFLGTVTKKSAQVAIAAIKAWSDRHRHQVVRVSSKDGTFEIPRDIDAIQRAILEKIVDSSSSGPAAV